MKPFSVLVQPGPLDPESAWGCLTANLAVPGFGSLMAGRAVGYVQSVLCALGLALTFSFGIRFAIWRFTGNHETVETQEDSLLLLQELWIHVRWALLGIAVFAVSWIWALFTSLHLLRKAKQEQPAGGHNIPPRISDRPGQT
jgi:hypothetical protein